MVILQVLTVSKLPPASSQEIKEFVDCYYKATEGENVPSYNYYFRDIITAMVLGYHAHKMSKQIMLYKLLFKTCTGKEAFWKYIRHKHETEPFYGGAVRLMYFMNKVNEYIIKFVNEDFSDYTPHFEKEK